MSIVLDDQVSLKAKCQLITIIIKTIILLVASYNKKIDQLYVEYISDLKKCHYLAVALF